MRATRIARALLLLVLVARPAPAQEVPEDASPRLKELTEALRLYQMEAARRRTVLSAMDLIHSEIAKAYAQLPEGVRGANAPRSIDALEEAARHAEESGLDRHPVVAKTLDNLKELVTRFVPYQAPQESKRRFFEFTVPLTELLIEGMERQHKEAMFARSIEESFSNLARSGRTASFSVEKNLLDWEKLLARKPGS
ncbi:MAG: hypothetical protein JNK60_16735 [Acidobacteria bacterium]|nr:hypothetical protein [Acidobacteriota bacterium]